MRRYEPSVFLRDDRTLSPRIYVAKHDNGRELSMMMFADGTISFRFIHFSHYHQEQYVPQIFASRTYNANRFLLFANAIAPPEKWA